MPLELEVIDLDPAHVVQRAQRRCRRTRSRAIVEVNPIDTRMLLSAELPLVLGAIELLLGAAPDHAPQGPPPDRDRLGARPPLLRARCSAQLSLIWTDVAERRARARRARGHDRDRADRAVSASRRSSLTVEARIARTSSTLALLVPCRAIAPVADRVRRSATAPARRRGRGRPARRSTPRCAASRSRCAPRSSDTQMPIEEVLALKPGDVLRLDGQAERGITLFADKVPVHRARPGRSGTGAPSRSSARVEDDR